MLVHIDSEEDLDPDGAAIRLPGRSAVLTSLAPLLAGLPAPEKIVLHYLGGQIEVEVFFGAQALAGVADAGGIESRLSEALKVHPQIRSLSVHALVAPK